jgi:lactoylglutathione lyase
MSPDRPDWHSDWIMPLPSKPIPVVGLFEAHLTVSDLAGSVAFYRDVLSLELAHVSSEPKVAFFWLGAPGQSMLGLWETGAMPIHFSGHVAFQVALGDLLETPERLRRDGIVPLDFFGHATNEPSVLAWMPAAAIYFHDPAGNLLEFIAMLSETAMPDLSVLSWSDWNRRRSH